MNAVEILPEIRYNRTEQANIELLIPKSLCRINKKM